MAQGSKQPEVLRELFQALGNDPFLIAECLARPTLAERLFTSALAHQDVSWAISQPTNSGKADRASFDGYTLPRVTTTFNGTGACVDAWAATSTVNAPTARDLHTAVWTGSEMIVWGGTNFSNYLNTGGRYNPSTDSWTATSTTSAPSARARHTAVWTGSEMIVWGGSGDSTGGKYNPMKTKHTAQFGSFNLQLVLCSAAVCSMITGTLLAFFHPEAPMRASQRTLTLAERIAYQRAIEQVYWDHRIWPKQRPDPKPSFDAVMSQAQLEKKVTDYLRSSRALDDYWQRPITAEQLQGEMDRMAEHTKQPQILRELFQALGGDPFVIAECLARPILAERLFNSALVSQNTSSAMTRVSNSRKTRRPQFRSYTLPIIPGLLKGEGTCNDAWGGTSTSNAPSARYAHTTVWTGSEMIVWGGFDGQTTFLNTGRSYNPSTDSWTATSLTNAPSARGSHTAVWTGTEMIVWGGVTNSGYLNSGGRYNPSTDSWVATSTTNAPQAREIHTSVWTGNEMIVWGGFSVTGTLNSGGKYNPGTDSWTATNTSSAPESRDTHTAIWTGSEMIVWGGADGATFLNTGGRYNPSTDIRVATSITNAPDPRDFHTAVWTGSEMIIWGGYEGSSIYWNTGGRYNPSTNSWTATSTTNAPAGRSSHTAVWTGSEIIVWGGIVNGPIFLNTGGRYNVSTDSWMVITTANAPEARAGHTAVWTGSEMIAWGGQGASHPVLNTGGRYCGEYPPPTPTPSPTPTIIVTNTNDSGPGSLRQTLADANDADVIGFAVTGTIGLTTGELLVTRSIIIAGPGAENLAVNGNNQSRVFHIASGQTVTISGLTITNGHGTAHQPTRGVERSVCSTG